MRYLFCFSAWYGMERSFQILYQAEKAIYVTWLKPRLFWL